MKRIFRTVAATVAIAGLLTGWAARAAEVTVFAAASLTDCLTRIGADYQRETGQTVAFSFEASSILARQIQEGAPADLFFSADQAQMDRLAKKGLIDPATRRDLLGNTLVVVTPAGSALEIHSAGDLAKADLKQIALADPAAVPAGVYAKAWFEKFHVWDAIRSKVVPAENVRGALAAVASGNVDAAVVYKTDAMISKHVKIAYEVPRADGPDIRYPVALVKTSAEPEAARQFLKCLESDQAARVFEKYGFTVRHE